MKKILTFAAIALMAVAAQAVAVGWTSLGMGTDRNGQAYQFFIVGQNGVTDAAQISKLIGEGKDVSAYAFGDGAVAGGRIQMGTSTSGKSLDAGTYTSFLVVYDKSTPASAGKFVLISGYPDQTKTFASSAASISFSTGNVSTYVNDAKNWQDVPEPTSLALIALGVAAFGLKRKHA